MAEAVCAFCKTPFEKKNTRHKFCSSRCNHNAWVQAHPIEISEYNRLWREGNPEQLKKYVRNRRIAPYTVRCLRCGTPFQNSSRKEYCSPACQRKTYWKNNKERATAAHAIWAKNNKNRVATLQKSYAAADRKRYPWHSLIRSTRGRARVAGIPYDLDFEWGRVRWTRFCELTGFEFDTPEKRTGHKNRMFFPCIDRIKPALGYVKNNCRIILWAVNMFKGDGSDADMYEIASALLENKSK